MILKNISVSLVEFINEDFCLKEGGNAICQLLGGALSYIDIVY